MSLLHQYIELKVKMFYNKIKQELTQTSQQEYVNV